MTVCMYWDLVMTVCTALGPSYDCVYVLHWDLVMTVCTALGPSYDCVYVLHWDLTVCMYNGIMERLPKT